MTNIQNPDPFVFFGSILMSLLMIPTPRNLILEDYMNQMELMVLSGHCIMNIYQIFYIP